MLLIAFSSPDKFRSEIKNVIDLFDAGLDIFHLRKPKFSAKKMEDYLRQVPKKYRGRIIIHSHYSLAIKYKLKGIHIGKKYKKGGFFNRIYLFWLKFRSPGLYLTTTFHSLLSLEEDESRYNYVILSPVFESISKKGYGASFSEDQLESSILRAKQKVVALGGVDVEKIPQVKELGFFGAGLLGVLWSSNERPVDIFRRAKEKLYNPKKGSGEIEINPVKIRL